MGAVASCSVTKELERIIGIPMLRDVTVHFPMHGVVSADVSFLLDEVQARAIVELCTDGKWRSQDE